MQRIPAQALLQGLHSTWLEGVSNSSSQNLLLRLSASMLGGTCSCSSWPAAGMQQAGARHLTSGPGASRFDAIRGPQTTGGPGKGTASSDARNKVGFFERQRLAFNAIPTLPKLLGFAGAIPFTMLTPSTLEPLGFSAYISEAAAAQVAYGGLIVSFLGAVHWGIAMTSTLAGPRAAAMLSERYTWSVFPSLAAWPAMMMEPGPGSFCIAILLAICYMSDRSYGRLGLLPTWYMTLRGYLTTLATLGMLSTTTWYLQRDMKAARQKEELHRNKAEATAPA